MSVCSTESRTTSSTCALTFAASTVTVTGPSGPVAAGVSYDLPSKTITLKSGHTLTVSTTAGVFDTGEDDRKFLFDLIDKLNAYERANEKSGD